MSSSAIAADDSSRRPAGLTATRVWSFAVTVGFAMAIVVVHLGQGVLLARLLGPVGRGQYAAAVLYSQLLLYIGLMGGLEVVCQRATRLAKRRGVSGIQTGLQTGIQTGVGGGIDRLRRAALRLGLTTGTVTMLAVMALAVLAMPAEKRDLVPLAIGCGLATIGQHVLLMMTGVDRGIERFAAYNWRRLIAAAVFPGMVAVAAMVTDLTVPMTVGLLVAASAVAGGICLIDLPRPFSGPAGPPVGRMLRRGRGFGVSVLATDLFERLDLVLVLWVAPLLQQGYYAAMVPAVYPLTVVPNTLGVFLFNAGADRDRRLTVGGVHRLLASSIAVQTVITVVFMLLIGWAVRLVYGPEFEPAVRYALWLAPASAIRGMLQGIDGYLKGRGRPMACVAARVVGAVTLLSLAAVWLPVHGVIAIAMAVLAAQVVCLLILIGVMYSDCRGQ